MAVTSYDVTEGSCVILDVHNLNAVYKLGRKFTTAVNYSNSVNRMATDIRAMPHNTELYLLMMPRQKGEGDYVVPSLSIGAVPFEVSAEEVKALYDSFSSLPNVRTIYLVHAMAALVAESTVMNFKTVFWYGNRIAVVAVEDQLIAQLEVFNTSEEFVQKYGDTPGLYSEYDIADKNMMQSKYPELRGLSTKQFRMVAPLVAAYDSPYRLDLAEVMPEVEGIVGGIAEQEMKDGRGDKPADLATEINQEPAEISETPVAVHNRTLEPQVKLSERKPAGTPKVRKRLGARGVLTALFVGLLSFFCGVGFSLQNSTEVISAARVRDDAYTLAAGQIDQLTSVYGTSLERCDSLSAMISYAGKSGLAVTLGDITSYTDKCVLTVNLPNSGVLEQYVSYLSQSYIVLSQDILNSDGATMQVNVTLVDGGD